MVSMDISRKVGPKVLFFDIETSPMLVSVWQPGEQYISHDQVEVDWSVLSWAANWDGRDEVMYMDTRDQRDLRDDKRILKKMWKLLDEADIVVTQNGRFFDQKKLFARFIINGFQPPSSFRHIDTKIIAKKHFGFTSASLEYMCEKMCKVYKKLKHKKFPGKDLWNECLKRNLEAWEEMEKYNKHDVLALKELWSILEPWDNSINFNIYKDGLDSGCKCGGEYIRNGRFYTDSGKFQRYRCMSCGSEMRGRTNLLDKTKKKTLLSRTPR